MLIPPINSLYKSKGSNLSLLLLLVGFQKMSLNAIAHMSGNVSKKMNFLNLTKLIINLNLLLQKKTINSRLKLMEAFQFKFNFKIHHINCIQMKIDKDNKET